MKKLLGPVERLYPMPCVLVVGGTAEGADTLAVAWLNVVSSTPPTIAMGLRESRHTLELIRATGEFTVNVPDTSLAAAVDYCGTTQGRLTNKFADAGLTQHLVAFLRHRQRHVADGIAVAEHDFQFEPNRGGKVRQGYQGQCRQELGNHP